MAAERIGNAWAAIWENGVWTDGVWEPVGEVPIGPEPTATGDFGRRRIATFVKRGGVGSLRGRQS